MDMRHAGHDHPGPLLGAIWGHWAIYTHHKVQPAALHCSLAKQNGQHGHGRILINDAAKQQNPTSCRGYFFLKVAIDRAPGALSIAGLEKKYPLWEVGFRCFAASLIRILPRPCWPWPSWSTFGCYMGPLRHLHAPKGPTCGTILQPSHLGHARLVRW